MKCATCGIQCDAWWSTAKEIMLDPPVVYCPDHSTPLGMWNKAKKE